MDELGSILREAREAKGLTVEEAQERTRISGKYLQALEEGKYEALPTAVHVRGFLRNYARFLSLDPQPLLERYETSRQNHHGGMFRSGNGSSPAAPLHPRHDQPFFDPVNLDLSGQTSSGPESTLRLVIIVALLIAITLAASRFVPLALGRGDGQETLTETIQGLLARDAEPEAEMEMEPAGDTDEEMLPGDVTPRPIIPTERNNPGALPTPAPPTPTRPNLPATMEMIQLRLDITERTWIRVTIDGEVLMEGQAKEGDGPFEWQAQQEATLLTGNAAGVYVTINGVELGRLAGRGEVWEETWQTTSTGN